MPPKRKGTSKTPAKARTPTLIDGLTKEEMTKEQLEEHIVHLREELDREREERNYFQLERDKIHTFWEITKRQLEEVKAEQKNLDKDTEEDEARHQIEIKVHRQKMKHLLCEHENTISELKAHALVSTELLQKEQEKLETELHKEIKAIMVEVQELDNESQIKELELKYDEEMSPTRQAWEKRLTEMKAMHEKKMELLPQELDSLRTNVISEREGHYNSYINDVIEENNKYLSYNDARNNNFRKDMEQAELLEKTIKDMGRSTFIKKKDLLHNMQENRLLTQRLSVSMEEITAKERKMLYPATTNDVNEKIKTTNLNDLKLDHQALEQKFCKLQQETDELYGTYTQNIEKVQQKVGLKSVMLEKKLNTLTDSLEQTQAQLSAVLTASNMDQTALSGIISKVEKNVDSSNNSIKNLKHKNAQISKDCQDLLLTFEAKQKTLGVPVEELCVKPFESSLAGKSLVQQLEFEFASQ